MRLKLQPIYSFLEQYIAARYRVSCGRKAGFVEFSREFGKIRMMVGIAKGEEKRVADPNKEPQRWKRLSVETVYPLIELGMDRKACQEYMRSVGLPVPPPSNCILCPFASETELLWLHRFMPQDFEDWVRIERNKLEKFKHLGSKNYGVFGPLTLPEVLERAKHKHGHMTDEDLQRHKFSHGHCVQSAY